MKKSRSANRLRYVRTEMMSPVGVLTLIASDEGLTAILWENDRPSRVSQPTSADAPDHPVLVQARRELDEYFDGRRQVFTVPLAPEGTPFQQAVWNALRTIPFGETRSYKQLAAEIGRPTATRAVGAANGRNPLSIMAPCHRVVGSNGDLTGFAAGVDIKARLLALESRARRFALEPPDDDPRRS